MNISTKHLPLIVVTERFIFFMTRGYCHDEASSTWVLRQINVFLKKVGAKVEEKALFSLSL